MRLLTGVLQSNKVKQRETEWTDLTLSLSLSS